MKRQTLLWLTMTVATAGDTVAAPQASIPFVFEKNAGQVDRQVRYFGRTQRAGLWLVDSGAVLSVEQNNQRAVLRMKLDGARPHPKIDGADPLPGRTNYFTGSDPTQWRNDIAEYGAVRYQEVYPGIDLLFHASGRTIEYDWIVAAGADPHQIRMSFQGASETRIDSSGDLVLRIGAVEVREHRPHVYQEGRNVAGRFVHRGRTIGFEVGSYDRSRSLTIDPVLTYATHLGGSGSTADQSGDVANAVAVDAQGNVIVAGVSYSTNFPTQNGLYTQESAVENAFIAKLNPAAANAASLMWSTYLGGNVTTGAYGIAVDSQNNVYITGDTSATNFPVMNAFQSTVSQLCNSSGAPVMCAQGFVTKISSAGNQLIYSSYLGGANSPNAGNAIAVDSAGDAWVTGYTEATDFPAANSLGGNSDGFVCKVSPSGSQLLYSAYLGGSNADDLIAIAVDNAGNAYVAGYSYSTNFPVINAYQAALPTANERAGVVAKINSTAGLVYSTYLGGTTYGGYLAAVAVDAKGNIYVGGRTATDNYPVTANAIQNGATFVQLGNGVGSVVSELNPSVSGAAQLEYSTYLTGGVFDEVFGIAVNGTGNIIVGGNTQSPSFPTTPGAFQSLYAGDVSNGSSTTKAFLAIIDPALAGLNGLVYSTLYGGSLNETFYDLALNATGTTAAIVGNATSPDLFVTASAYQQNLSSTYGDAFIATFNLTQSGPVIDAMTNAASFAVGNTAFAPGEIVTVFGANLGPQTLAGAELDPSTGLLASTLEGCQFLVNNTPAPLDYVYAPQTTAFLPYELTPNIGQSLINYGQMVCNGVPGNVFEFAVVAANPGIFFTAGSTQAAVLNQDGSPNSASNPAAAGSIITIFETGEGVLTPAGQDGRVETGPVSSIPKPALPVAVLFGTTPSPMLTYAAVAPDEVDGVLQIDAQVPAGLTAGNVPLMVTIGTYSSQKGLTIAVQ